MSRVLVPQDKVESAEKLEVVVEVLNSAVFKQVVYADSENNRSLSRVGKATNVFVSSAVTRNGGKPTQVGLTVQQVEFACKALKCKRIKLAGLILVAAPDEGAPADGGSFSIRSLSEWKGGNGK